MSNNTVYDFPEPPFPLVPSGISTPNHHNNNNSTHQFLETLSSEGIEGSAYDYDFNDIDAENENENDESRSGSEDISTPGPSGTFGKKSSSFSNNNGNGKNKRNNINGNAVADAGAPIAAGGAEGDIAGGGDASGAGVVKKAGASITATNKVFRDEDALNKYLKRRQNNNAAACKSRMKKKEMEQQNVERANRLEAENLQLRTELQQLEFEAKYLKEVLQSVLSKKTGN